jgi:VCBS repeat protein
MLKIAIGAAVLYIVISGSGLAQDMAASGCAGQPDGTACEDGYPCTVGESCHSGTCIASVRFAQAGGSPIQAGILPQPVPADLNLDGVLDLAVLIYPENKVTALLGDGTGRFAPSGPPTPVMVGAQRFAVGDFNVDGKPDIAIVSAFPGRVGVYLGDGTGQFAESPDPPIQAGEDTVGIAVADFNLDGKPDVVTADLNIGTLQVLLGNGAGGFREAAGSPVPGGSGPGLAVVDFNLDARPDIAVVDQHSGTAVILLGDGSGSFNPAPGSPVPVGFGVLTAGAGDFNSDGKQDLVVAGQSGVMTLLGDGSGRFEASAAWASPTRSSSSQVSVGDFNADRKPDIAVLNYSAGDLTVLLGNGLGGFVPIGIPSYVIGKFPVDAATGDFNRDGNADLAVARSVSNPADGALKILLGVPEVARTETPCSDGNLCTTNGECHGAICLGTPVACDDGNACTDDLCDPGSGCSFMNNSAPCDDGDACTLSDSCSAGGCAGHNPVVCTAVDPCHAAGVCDPGTGICSNPNQLDGTACSDDDACTPGDQCVSGVCRGLDADGDATGDLCDACPLDPQNDADRDGICGNLDACAESSLGPTVSISDCDSGVANTLFANGCTVQDSIDLCVARGRNHGALVSCVSQLTDGLKRQGALMGREKARIERCAAQSGPHPAPRGTRMMKEPQRL